jgi:N6-adenosine-specific RNA methylase IME4
MELEEAWGSGKKYRVIYADPPWNFATWSKKGAKKSAQRHYSCMSMADIHALPVSSIAADDSLLFMWVTDPLLDKQFSVIQSWGFRYVTVGFTWIKMNKKTWSPFIGCGYYTRSNPEMCLIGRRGDPGRPNCKIVEQVVHDRIREHSRKPDRIRTDIERMYDGPYCELFARTEIPGWDCYGNQVGKFTEGVLDYA